MPIENTWNNYKSIKYLIFELTIQLKFKVKTIKIISKNKFERNL